MSAEIRIAGSDSSELDVSRPSMSPLLAVDPSTTDDPIVWTPPAPGLPSASDGRCYKALSFDRRSTTGETTTASATTGRGEGAGGR
jgi:hypothetical protein